MDLPLASSSLRERLLEEHVVIANFLEQVISAVETKDFASATKAWLRFRIALLAHLAAEDAQLIAALPRAYETNGRVLNQEHQHLRERVKELNDGEPCTDKCLPELRVLRDILAAHARNDDRLLYDWAEAQLAEPLRATALDALASRLEPLKDNTGK